MVVTVPTENQLSYYKILVTNHVIEVYEMEKQPYIPDDRDRGNSPDTYDKRLLARTESIKQEALKEMRENKQIEMIEKADRKRERRGQTLRDARNTCRRLALANFNEESLFITLTYAENMQDIKQADDDFKKFIKRFRYKFGKFHYIGVREFQKRGAIHYHMICDAQLSWKDNNDLMELEREFGIKIWGHGFVDIQRLNKTKKEGKNVDNVGAYLTEYMTKEYDDGRLRGHKAYLCSRGLERPQEFKGTILDENIRSLIDIFKQKKETFTNSYESEYLGKIIYKEYNLKRA